MFYAARLIISLIYLASCSVMALSKCRDESIFCNVTKMNICARPDLSKYCQKTCHLCDDEAYTVIPVEECSDQWTNCTELDPTKCLSNPDIATIYCAKTCNNCMATTIATTITTTTTTITTTRTTSKPKPSVATHSYSSSLLTIIYCILFFTTIKFMA